MGGTMHRSIGDYHSLISKTVSGQKHTAEAREELYERARTALMTEFGKLDPPASDAEIFGEQFKLDFAIHDFEWSTATEMSYANSA
jgi:hypothetical protein